MLRTPFLTMGNGIFEPVKGTPLVESRTLSRDEGHSVCGGPRRVQEVCARPATTYRHVDTVQKRITAAPSVLVWSPTTILGKALRCLNMTDRTGSLAFTWVWPQLERKCTGELSYVSVYD